MAKTFKCEACGAEISKKTEICPHCGHKYKRYTLMEKFMLTVIGIAGVLIAIGIIFADHDQMPKQNQTDKVTQAITSSTAAKPKVKAVAGYKKYKAEIDLAKEKLDKALSKENKVMARNFSGNFLEEHFLYVNVAVVDDGTNRDGYADYICLLANDAGLLKKKYGLVVWVKVNDAKAAIGAGKIRVIGEKKCVSGD